MAVFYGTEESNVQNEINTIITFTQNILHDIGTQKVMTKQKHAL